MKFSLTKFELFVVANHLGMQPSPSPEHGRKRLKAWDELGVVDLADTLEMIRSGFPGEVKVADWADKSTPVEVDLSIEIVTYMLNGLAMEAKVAADTITRVRERLEKASKEK